MGHNYILITIHLPIAWPEETLLTDSRNYMNVAISKLLRNIEHSRTMLICGGDYDIDTNYVVEIIQGRPIHSATARLPKSNHPRRVDHQNGIGTGC